MQETHGFGSSPGGASRPGSEQELDRCIAAGQQYLLSLQHDDGHWCAELEGDSILESEYFLLLHFLGRSAEPRALKLAAHLRQQQSDDGGWTTYAGGPSEVSASVKAYLVLKICGDDPDAPHMRRARRAILDAGGLDACNSFTKLYLSIFGQYEWSRAPAVPPELSLLPRWFYFNIYEMSSWSRAIVVPLSIVWACKPRVDLPPRADLSELRSAVRVARSNGSPRTRFFAALFRGIDRAIKLADAIGVLRLTRARALERSRQWVLRRLDKSAGLAAIFPAIVNTVVALVCLGRKEDAPVIAAQLEELEKLEIDDGATLRLQPCCSPVWDTALALGALLDAGTAPSEPAVQGAVEWLLDHEVREAGDWRCKNPDGPVGGWYFEYANEFYPDCDDTAEILAVLSKVRMNDGGAEERRQAAVARGLAWQLSMQNRDGGWGAFDRECNKELLTLVPFADHNAMIDPSTSDVTARSLEALRLHNFDRQHPAVRAAVSFLHREQEPEGCWYGRWGANYIYGTWLALVALRAAGERASGRDSSPFSRRGADWLLSCQNPDGGWGESLHSYEDPATKGRGVSTASQTAWAILGLLAAGEDDPKVLEAVRRGAAYLRSTQLNDGSWHDELWTGTGFPRVFYLRYHLYASYFPLQALASYRRVLEARRRMGRAA